MTTLAEEAFIYEPFGRSYVTRNHPCQESGDPKNGEQWIIKDIPGKSDNVSQETEVYFRDRIAVWSQGTAHRNAKRLSKCIVTDTPILQVNTAIFPTEEEGETDGACLCILENSCLTISTRQGSVFTNALPFKIKRMWPTFNGLCVERRLSDSEASQRSMPTLFTLCHPLEDLKPVIFHMPDTKRCLFVTDMAQHIVHSQVDPPLLVTYDTTIGIHSIWHPRKATEEDQPVPLNVSGTLPEFASVSFAHTSHVIMNDQSRLSLSPLNVRHLLSPMAGRHMPSPIRPIPYHSPLLSSTGNQPSMVSSFCQSPTVGIVNRLNSPLSEIAHESPRAEMRPVSNTTLKGRMSSPFMRMSLSDSVVEDLMFEPLPPDVCLDFVWQEDPDPIRHGSKGMADCVFLTRDFLQHSYLGILVKYLNRLRLFKTDSHYTQFTHREDLVLRDVSALNNRHYFVGITLENEVLLYSGSIRVCKLDIASSVERCGTSHFAAQKACWDSVKTMPSPVSGLTEQISALSTSSEIYDSVFRDGSFVSSLQDGTGCHVTVVLSNGVMVRSKVAALASSGVVRRCLDAIVQDIEDELAVSILSKFYVALNNKQVSSVACGSPFRKMADMLLQLMGFPEFSRRVLQEVLANSPSPPERKKPKKSESLSGSEDWEQLLESEESILLLNMSQTRSCQKRSKLRKTSVSELSLTISCPLYEYTLHIFQRLSYLYEELKLNSECLVDWCQLGAVLHFLAMCLGMDELRQYYEHDAVEQNMLPKHCYRICRDQLSHLMTKSDAAFMFCLEDALLQLMKHGKKVTIPQGAENKKLTSIVQVFESLVAMDNKRSDSEEQQQHQDNQIGSFPGARKLISCLLDAGFDSDAIRRLPFGFAIPVLEVLQHMGFNRGVLIDAREATLVGREDIALLHRKSRRPLEEIAEAQKSHGVDDGMQFDDQVLRTIFNQDLRVDEVRSLLQSSHPVIINLAQKPEVSDYEFVREQEACLMMISKRTMALSVGRGMFTLGTAQPSMSETLTIPVLEMTGKAVQSNKTVSLAQMDLPGDLLHWPSFHNGVAAGLKVASGSSRVNSTWIVYNKLKYAELTEEHAGFLMALGLMGHLAVLPIHQLHDYLIRGHDLTSVALLLGMAATRVGTRDSVLYKVLSLHIESLLPPTALELGIPHAAHVAAIVAVGMLFSESGDSHLVRVMLREISRPPGPEMENAVDRESHALAAGMSLGMIMLGRGAEPTPDDLDVGYELYHYIVGGERRHTHIDAKEKYRVPSHLVKEENLINTDVTAPSAIVALALMYLKTNNRDVANWLKPSDTITLLETIKPDHLLLKVMARGLIMWDSVNPSLEWINAHLEEVFKKPEIASIDAIDRVQQLSSELDVDTISQCHSCIIAGCSMSLGFKFAGSFNQDAFNTLLFCTKHFLLQLTSPLFEKRGQSVVEMCLVSSLLSLAMVVAGSGNLEVLRIARRLHKRCTPDVTYGSHLAVHMAIGLLFLGGGRYTLKTSNLSVAVLLCAVYPKFPHTSRDNRYHLQALRHLYVLACEPRLLIPRDIDSKQICYAPVEVTLKANLAYPECTIKLLAPCFLPELHFIKEISIVGPRYWPLTISLQDTTLTRDEMFRIIACFNVTKKAGHLPYKDDPKGYKNLMARTFAGQKNQIEAIQSFTADPRILSFTELVCKDGDGLVKDSKTEAYARALFECVTREKTQVLNTYLAVEQVLDKLERGTASSRDIGQLALLLTFYERVHPHIMEANLVGKPLIDEEFVALVRLRLRKLHRQTLSRDIL